MQTTGFSSGSATLDSILNQGAYLVISRFDKQEQVLAKTHALLHEGVDSLAGGSARRTIERRGLRALHEVLPAEQIGPLRDFVMPQIRADLFSLAWAVGRKMLGIEGEFFIDDYTILRINYPYEVAMRASRSAENPGIGRVAEKTREYGNANKIVDPVYDPKGYHNNEPPPAWAHGPHQDTWTGHSRWGVNLWWAIEDVPGECSMVFYPGMFGRPLEPDPRSLYLKAGQPLPKPAMMDLRCGEMLVFNPEMLHGTHLNTTRFTRLALSSRLNPRRPKFDPGCFYAREFWHSSDNIEDGRFDRVVRFVRAENLDCETDEIRAYSTRLPDVIAFSTDTVSGEWQKVCPSARLRTGEKLLIERDEAAPILLVRGHEGVHAVQLRCPHLDVSLADGYHDDENIWCPAHAVAFSLDTGRSSCESLKLRTYQVREEEGFVWLRN